MSIRCLFYLFVLAAAAISSGCARSTEGGDTPSGESSAATNLRSVPEVEVELARAVRSDLTAAIELVGSLTPRRRTVVVAEVDGVIREIPASRRERIEAEIDGQRISEAPRLDIGVHVAQGDLLVQLDSREYELKRRAAQARVDVAKAELEKLKAWHRPEEVRRAQASRDEASASLILAEADMARAKPLLDRKAVSQAEYDKTVAAAKVARAALDRADADLALAQAGPTKEETAVAEAAVQQAEAELKRSEWDLERTTIRAPYDGVITDRYVDEGDRVTAMPRVEIMELMDLSLLTAQLGVAERYIGQIHVGDPAVVHVKGSADAVPGMVVLINDKVDAANRNYRIRVALRNEQRRFKAGQFARVTLQVKSAPQALTIPARAISYTGGEPQVFVYTDGRVRQRAVALGITNDKLVEVLSGLTEGEQVVVEDPSILADGMPVRVRRTASSTQRPASAT
jgi:HlyD family secretion protein